MKGGIGPRQCADVDEFRIGYRHGEGVSVEQDLQFHQTLFRISGNRVCNMMFTVVHQSVRKLMALTATAG